MNAHILRIEKGLSPLKQQLVHHPLYLKIKSPQHLHAFMEQHVFAVWDFMSLLKFLQRELTCINLPWVPSANTAAVRMINEIVLGEESDVDKYGKPASHYQLYLKAMDQVGADTKQIKKLIMSVRRGDDIRRSINQLGISKEAKAFMDFTFQTIDRAKVHEVAAVLTWGREDMIPDMFTALVKDIQQNHHTNLEDFIYYLERHIELDADEHGPMAMQMMEMLCGDDQQKWNQCYKIAQKALKARITLWDGIADAIT